MKNDDFKKLVDTLFEEIENKHSFTENSGKGYVTVSDMKARLEGMQGAFSEINNEATNAVNELIIKHNIKLDEDLKDYIKSRGLDMVKRINKVRITGK